MRLLPLIAFGLALALALTSSVAAAFPLSYSGRLTTSAGEPVQGTVELSFAFYAVATGGSALGPGVIVKPGLVLSSGLFQVELNLTDGDAGTLFTDPANPVYIEVTDVTNAKVYPRQKFSVIPYALRVPVDGTSIGYTSDGKLEALNVAGGDITRVIAGAGLSGGGTNGDVTVSLNYAALPLASGGSDGMITSTQFNAFNGKEPAIATGATTEFWRGDKSWHPVVQDQIVDGVTATAPTQNAVFDNIIAKKGVANGYAGLDTNGKVPAGQLPFSGLAYKGTWDAGANTPVLVTGVCGTQGDYYITSAGGATSLDGITPWSLGDWAICGASGSWQRVGNSVGGVSTVNGLTGTTIDLTTDDVDEGIANKYYDSVAKAKVDAHDAVLSGSGVDAAEFARLNGVTSPLQTQLNAKAAATHTHAATEIGGTTNVSDAEYNFLDGVTLGIQSQINGKAATAHVHSSLDASDGNPANALVVDADGEVGIGTTAPAFPLDVIGAGSFNSLVDNPRIYLRSNAAATYSNRVIDVTAGNFRIYRESGPEGTQVFMTIPSNGNVGIGTTNPTAKLHVGGTPGVDGIKFPDGTVQTSAAAGVPGGGRQVFAATTTFTVPAGITTLYVEVWGGGGGGACQVTGGTGGTSTFGSGLVSATGGGGGRNATYSLTPGAGTAGDVLLSGGWGMVNDYSTNGGGAPLGGSGGTSGRPGYSPYSAPGTAPGGGGGGGSNGTWGSGGSGGGYAHKKITGASGTYAVTVGAGGASGAGSCGAGWGGPGATGLIIVNW